MRFRRLAIFAVVLAGAAATCGSACPQARVETRVLSAEEIAERLAQRGYREVAPPMRRGQIYLVEVTDREGARRVLVVTVTEALIVGDGPASRQGQRVPHLAIPTAAAQ